MGDKNPVLVLEINLFISIWILSVHADMVYFLHHPCEAVAQIKFDKALEILLLRGLKVGAEQERGDGGVVGMRENGTKKKKNKGAVNKKAQIVTN